jgi:hypothetical protein
MDMQGRAIPIPGSEVLHLHQGFNRLELSTAHWSPGVYLLHLVTNQEVRSAVLVKQ